MVDDIIVIFNHRCEFGLQCGTNKWLPMFAAINELVVRMLSKIILTLELYDPSLSKNSSGLF